MGRLKERIPIFLNLLDFKKFTDKYGGGQENSFDILMENIGDVISCWMDNPDLRFGQTLINLGLIPDWRGPLYYLEEDDILLSQGVHPREFTLWGTYGLDIKERMEDWKNTYSDFGLSKAETKIRNISSLRTEEARKSKRTYYLLKAWHDVMPSPEYKPIKNLDTKHIEAIIETETFISPELRKILEDELEFRKEKDEKIE